MRGFALGLVIVVAGPMVGFAQNPDPDVVLERTVRDDARGVRAVVHYRPFVMIGGQEEIRNEDGTVSILHWDGFTGQFTARIIEGGLVADDREAFLREAVIAVCPSVDRSRLAEEQVQVSLPVLSIYANCPEVDARLE